MSALTLKLTASVVEHEVLGLPVEQPLVAPEYCANMLVVVSVPHVGVTPPLSEIGTVVLNCWLPLLTVRRTLNGPPPVNVCDGAFSVDVPPSPKFQLNECVAQPNE